LVRIRIENLRKEFAKTIAVESLNLDIRDKEFFVLLGPSGSGKSTVLNCIAGLEALSGGHVYFDDECVDSLPPEKRDIAMVFQSYALYPHMNVFDNISFSLRIRNVPRVSIEKKVEETSKMLKITDLLKRKPYELSGGERQRVALARAIVRDPKVFLMDEPMSNVDAKLRVSMRAELIRLQKQLRTTTVYVTHDQVEAMTMADRVAILDKGKLQQCDPPIQIYKHPGNMFVGGFIGSPAMNFFDCSWNEKEEYLDAASFKLKLPDNLARIVMDNASSAELSLGVRPQNLTVYEKRESPDHVKAEIYAVEPMGSETLVDLKVGDWIVRAVVSGEYMRRIGDEAWIKIDTKKIYLFDRKTEKNIL
jgi:multiple sugar transport system ATP-binding protein